MKFPAERLSRKYRIEREGPAKLPPREGLARKPYTVRTLAEEVARVVRQQPGEAVRITGDGKRGYFVHINLRQEDQEKGAARMAQTLNEAFLQAQDNHGTQLRLLRENAGLVPYPRVFFFSPHGKERERFHASASIGIQFHPTDAVEPPQFTLVKIKKTVQRREVDPK